MPSNHTCLRGSLTVPFDMATIIFVYILACYLCAVLLALLWWKNRQHFAGLHLFSAGIGLQAVGMSMSVLRSFDVTPAISIVASNMTILAALTVLVAGLARFLGHRLRYKGYVIYIFLFGCAYIYPTFIQPDIRARIILFSAAAIPVFLHNAYFTFFKADEAHRRFTMPVAVSYILLATVSAMRIGVAIFTSSVPVYFTTGLTDSALVVASMLLTLTLTYSVQLMCNNKLVENAENSLKEQNKLLNQLEKLATFDALTNIFNRRKTDILLRQSVEYAKRYNQPVSVLLCDVDRFKAINDTHGHDAGDNTLIALAKALDTHKRKVDLLGRWGGEEFLLITPGLSLEKALEAADRIRGIIERLPQPHLPGKKQITLSIGVAQWDGDETMDSLLQRADKALYSAKKEGRNKVCCS